MNIFFRLENTVVVSIFLTHFIPAPLFSVVRSIKRVILHLYSILTKSSLVFFYVHVYF